MALRALFIYSVIEIAIIAEALIIIWMSIFCGVTRIAVISIATRASFTNEKYKILVFIKPGMMAWLAIFIYQIIIEFSCTNAFIIHIHYSLIRTFTSLAIID